MTPLNAMRRSRQAKVLVSIALVLVLAAGMFPLQSALNEYIPALYVGMLGEAGAESADYTCDGANDHVEVQQAVDALPVGGGEVHLLSGTYSFGSTVTRAIDGVTICANGWSTYLTYNGATALISDSGQSRWVIRDLRTDAGGVTLTGTGSGRDHVWIGSTLYNDFAILSVNLNSESELESQLADASNVYTNNDSTVTLDAEWDSIGEIEVATGVDILITTEVDSESELEVLLIDVSDVFTNNDGSLADDNLSNNDLDDLGDVNAGAPADNQSLTWDTATSKWIPETVSGGAGGNITSVGDVTSGDSFTADGAGNSLWFEGTTANTEETKLTAIDPTNDNTINLPDASGNITLNIDWDTIGEIESATSVNILISTEVDSEGELESLLADVSDVFTNNDTIPEANIAAALTRDAEWDSIGEIEVATGVDILVTTELDAEGELEALLADVIDVFTDNDGALNDDDLSDDDLDALQNVAALTEANGDILYYNSGAWQVLTVGSNGDVLKLAAGLPSWATDDDVPESGDFGAAGDLDADGTLSTDATDDTEIDWGTGANQVSGSDAPDEDLGDVSVSGGVWSVDADAVALETDTTGDYVGNVTNSDGYLSVTGSGEDAGVVVNHAAVDRIFILTACGGVANETTPPDSMYENVTFNGFTSCVCEFTAANQTIGWAAWLPPDFGTGGTKTVTAKFCMISNDATTGNVTLGLKGADTRAGIAGAVQQTATAVWATDEEDFVSSATSSITIAGTPNANEMVYFECELTADNLDGKIYIQQVIVTFKGV